MSLEISKLTGSVLQVNQSTFHNNCRHLCFYYEKMLTVVLVGISLQNNNLRKVPDSFSSKVYWLDTQLNGIKIYIL